MKTEQILFSWLLASALAVSFTHSTNASLFSGLGDLAGGQFDSGLGPRRIETALISRDGSVVVGTGTSDQERREAFRWTLDSGMVGLGNLLPPGAPDRPNPIGPFSSTASGVNAHGDVVVGYSVSEKTDHQEAYRWTQDNGMVGLGFLRGFEPWWISRTRPLDVSDDGSIIVGLNHTFETNPAQRTGAFRWTETDGMVELRPPEFTSWPHHEAKLVSGDGAVIIGASRSGGDFRALWRWSEQAGSSVLDQYRPALRSSSATDITADGSVIVGYGGPPSNSVFEPSPLRPYRWTEESGPVDLAGWDLNVFGTVVQVAVTDDGATIVGSSSGSNPSFIWDEQNGMRNLSTVLASEHGLADQMAGWITLRATDISGDGRRIVGNGVNPQGFNESWIAILEGGLPAGDFNGNGLVEQADLNLVLQKWGQPASAVGHPWINDLPTGAVDQNELDAVVLNWHSSAGALDLSLGSSNGALNANFDLKTNPAIINYTGPSPVATVHQQILAGRGGPGLGQSWNGNGITSSAAAAANEAEPESRSIGYAENSALPLGPYTTFRGLPVDDTSLLIAYTRTGDANLDGVVNDDDVTIVGATYAPGVPQPFWALGDFDYNGFVDDDDITLLGVFYDPSAPPAIAAVEVVSGVVAVPEPATWALFVSATLVLILFGARRAARLHPAPAGIGSLCCVLLAAHVSQAGVIESGPAYLANVTTAPNLVVNNDDYTGAFADNPNKANINRQSPRQSIGSIERIIPTTSSGGITEYAVSVGGNATRDNLDLNGIFQLQVGFGTGQNFVPASLVAPGLRFDTSENVNPPVPDFRLGLPGPIPQLRLLQHAGDTLTFQGSSTTGMHNLVDYASPEIFKFPLDVPDLNASLRDQFYSPAELAGLPAGTVPFTIRTTVVPEPSGVVLIVAGVASLLIASAFVLKRRNSREQAL